MQLSATWASTSNKDWLLRHQRERPANLSVSTVNLQCSVCLIQVKLTLAKRFLAAREDFKPSMHDVMLQGNILCHACLAVQIGKLNVFSMKSFLPTFNFSDQGYWFLFPCKRSISISLNYILSDPSLKWKMYIGYHSMSSLFSAWFSNADCQYQRFDQLYWSLPGQCASFHLFSLLLKHIYSKAALTFDLSTQRAIRCDLWYM